jgi:hypothetical protein
MLDVGCRLELFVDETLLERMRGVHLHLHTPTPQNVVLRCNQPWEGPSSAYFSVFQDEGLCRMYYRGGGDEGQPEVTCTAVSEDGIHWRKPELGLGAREGRQDTNIIVNPGCSHNFAPFLDANPNTKPSQRYKAFAGLPPQALVSADATTWTIASKTPAITHGAFDSLNTVSWDVVQGQYVAYIRSWDDGTGEVKSGYAGLRHIARSVSPDFRHWSHPMELDLGNSPREQLYTNSIIAYPRAPHIYLGFPKRFMEERKAIASHPEPGVSDAVFMCSRDGLHWERRFMEAFLRPGRDPKNWTDRNNMVAWGILQTADDELSLYVSEHYRQRTNRLRRHTLRLDGFVSVRAGYAGGQFTTPLLKFAGQELVLNYATSAAGRVRVEVQDREGKAVPGFALRDCAEIYGDHIERAVRWRGGDLSALAGQGVRLRFEMKDADLFSLRFR